jgi:YHS domain-containing protein
MPTTARATILLAVLATALTGLPASLTGQTDGAEGRDLPPALASFEFLIGRWKGQGVPRDNPSQRFRGWTEAHTWAWVFVGGKPVAMTVSIQGGKVLSQGTLRYEPTSKQYLLDAREPGESAKPVRFTGTLDSSGKLLTLECTEKGTTQRLTFRANSNYIRYTMVLDRKERTAALFQPLVEIGLTKEGESFAAGSSAVEQPKCIVTGGAATLTVSYQGQSFPICCTGCRDEFNENPEKYLKKLSLKVSAGRGTKTDQPKTSRVSRFEDAFSGDINLAESQDKAKMADRTTTEATDSVSPARETAEPKAKAGPKPDAKAQAPDKLAAKAATALRLAQNLEKSGKSAAALKSYKQIVKDYPKTATARVAAERIKAIESQ